MKQLAFAISAIFVLTLGLAASTPARADFAVVQFENGHCQIWWDSGTDPWGAGWRKIAIGLPDWPAARAVLDSARSQDACR